MQSGSNWTNVVLVLVKRRFQMHICLTERVLPDCVRWSGVEVSWEADSASAYITDQCWPERLLMSTTGQVISGDTMCDRAAS